MAISVIGPQPLSGRLGFRIRESWTQSTATTFRTINLFADRVHLGVGTATGITRNLYSLASGATDGREMSLLVTATGEANLFIFGTATGLHVFTEADDFIRTIFEEGKWRLLNSSATLASTT